MPLTASSAIPNAAPAEDLSAPMYFLHIPKTAGTSFHRLLSGNFQERDVCPAHLWHNLLELSPEKVGTYRFIWGHFYCYLCRHVSSPLRYLTLLRDPVERALSHYGHIVYYKEHYLHARARELGSFSAFLRDPEMATTLTNFQVRALSHDQDPHAVASTLTKSDLAGTVLEHKLETAVPALSDEEALQVAKLRLGQMCFVGIAERMDSSVDLLCRKFAGQFSGKVATHNIGVDRLSRAEIPQSDYALLMTLNEADFELYEYASGMMSAEMERLSETGAGAT